MINFQLMFAVISADIQNFRIVACAMDWVGKVESGLLNLADVNENVWVIDIMQNKVWFEGLYSQSEGGEISFSQFESDVRTYLQLLSDPEQKLIEVEFPAV